MPSARPSKAAAPRPGPDRNELRILKDPTFQTLVQERSRFAWTLSAIMLVVYLGFIFLVALGPGLMATQVFGGPTSLGVVLGLAVIIFAFVLTGVYVSRANSRFDDLTRQLNQRRTR